MTHRRLQVLIDRLPHESATKTEIRDAMDPADLAAAAAKPQTEHGPWSHTDYLLATVIDRLDMVWHAVYTAAHFSATPIERYPRPGLVSERADGPDPAAVAFIERQRERHRKAQADAAAKAAGQQDQ